MNHYSTGVEIHPEPGEKNRLGLAEHQWDLFEAVPYAFFSVGVDGRIRLANQRAVQMLGYPLGELLGRSVFDLYADTPTGKIKAEQLFLKFRAGTSIRGEELAMRRADGTPVWVHLSVRGIWSPRGDLVASWSIVREVGRSDKSQRGGSTGHSGSSNLSVSGKQLLGQPIGLESNCEFRENHLTRLMVKEGRGRLVLLSLEEVDWIESASNYVQIHVGARSCLIRETMNGLQSKLDPSQFIRIHRSTIVNIERIKEFRPWSSGSYKLILQNGVRLTLSRSYRDRFSAQVRKEQKRSISAVSTSFRKENR